VQIEATGFYTLLNNAIVQQPFSFNDSDSILFSGVKCQVFANTNKSSAYLYGLQVNLLAQMNNYLSLKSNITYTYGHVKDDNVPLDHIPPVFGNTSLNLEYHKIKAEFSVKYNAKKKLSEYSPSGEDNLDQAPKNGMPAWYTLNLMGCYQFNRFINLQLGVENILDAHYRYFASGISAPGRNVIVALRINL
jgi:hemoglobin/transferrin/lactoferrin receptor protein